MRLLTHAVKTSATTRNTAPVLSLLSSFYPLTDVNGQGQGQGKREETAGKGTGPGAGAGPGGESKESDGTSRAPSLMGCEITSELQEQYLALASVLRAANFGGLFTSTTATSTTSGTSTSTPTQGIEEQLQALLLTPPAVLAALLAKEQGMT